MHQRADSSLSAHQLQTAFRTLSRLRPLRNGPADELVQSMAQALAHAQGKKSGVRTRNVVVTPDDVQKRRTASSLLFFVG
jgi:hypothetical protein